MQFSFKVISIILSIIIVISAAGVLIYRNYESKTFGKIDFYIASDEAPNVSNIYITVSDIGVYNGYMWSNHSVDKTTDLYLDNFSHPGIIAEISLPHHTYTYFKLYLSSAYIEVSGVYKKVTLTPNYTKNSLDLNLTGGTTVNLLFSFEIARNLNISNQTLTPVTNLTEKL
ncbi:hypothetical protein OXIME_001336 [Oxyplasma meridianum]|uniref:DUF4382 domain-containing protein n=1 Tax=Oxyplasma meridianum TaxID=3073602 RepID=A0AAX4NHR8_9ARCH